MKKRMVIINEEISIDAYDLCNQLKDQARSMSSGSDCIDRVEWKAANVIKRLLYDIDEAKENQ